MPHLHLTNREWESTEYCENQLMNASRDHNEFCQYWKLVFEEMVAIDDGREADHHLRPRQPIRGPTNASLIILYFSSSFYVSSRSFSLFVLVALFLLELSSLVTLSHSCYCGGRGGELGRDDLRDRSDAQLDRNCWWTCGTEI